MNGVPLQRDGKYAAMRRVPAEGEHRANMHASGTAEKVKLSEQALAVAEMVRPKLVQDGLFLVGLDLVGDKILEINVFTPGGLLSIGEMYRADFVDSVVQAIESKTRSPQQLRRHGFQPRARDAVRPCWSADAFFRERPPFGGSASAQRACGRGRSSSPAPDAWRNNSAPPSGSPASDPTSPDTPRASCRRRSSDAASASSASSRPQGRRCSRR